MKKAIILALFTLIVGNLCAQNDTTQFVRNGNTFSKVEKVMSSKDTETPFTYEIGNIVYPIYITPNGRCYIIRVSKKSGKEYKQYICKEVCLQICKELNIEYKEL